MTTRRFMGSLRGALAAALVLAAAASGDAQSGATLTISQPADAQRLAVRASCLRRD